MPEALRFELTRKEIPVVLTSPEGQEKEKYVLRELTGKGRDLYLTRMSGKMKYKDDGEPIGITDYSGLQAYLVHLHLYDQEGVQVSFDEVQSYPSSVVSQLFEAAQALSNITGADEEELGND